MATGLPGLRPMNDRELERENRRRKRKGLPLVEGAVPASAKGWDAPETPTPPAVSLAGALRPAAQTETRPHEELETGLRTSPRDSDPTMDGPPPSPTTTREIRVACDPARPGLTPWPTSSLAEPLPVAATVVGFLGPLGTFTEEALRATLDERTPSGRSRRFQPFGSMQETIEAVSSGTVDCASSLSRTRSKVQSRPRSTCLRMRSTTCR